MMMMTEVLEAETQKKVNNLNKFSDSLAANAAFSDVALADG